jgi:hypothetical protein
MKAFRYVNGSDFRQVTENQILAQVAELPPKSHLRSHVADVLSLEIGQSVTFESGVEWTRIADDSQPFAAIVCNRGSRARRCEFCGTKLYAGLLCDGPPTKKGKKTCDAFMCRTCGKNVGPDRDLCPRCVPLADRRQA